MSDGRLPGSVAPTSIGSGKSYSEMMNEQIALIQQQRSANLDKRLAQEEKNRQFRTEQLQNIYDFDVSGLASGDVRVLADMQRQLAASLDPNSESSYSDSQQLVADIALINNAYNEMKRWADSGGQGRQLYQNGLLQPERGDGTVVVADEDMLNSRNEVWEKGAFAEGSVRLVGPPGNRQLVGMALDVDGNEVGEVNFFENSMRNQPDQFWRQEVMPAAPYAATLTERALTDERLDGRNTREIAEIDFAVMNQQAKDRFRKEQYEKVKPADGKAFEELTEEDYKRLKIDDESLINEMVADYDKGLDARPGTAGADAFDFNRSIANMPQLSEPVKLRSEYEELAGTIEGAQFQQGLDLDTLQKAPNGAPLIPVEVAYVQSNGTIVKKVLDPATNPVEYDAFMEAIGRRGKEQLLQYSGYYQTPEGPQVDVGEDPQASSPRDMGVDETAEVRENLEDIEDLTITGSADGSPGAKLESDRQMLLDDIKDAEDELKLQMSLAGGNAGNLTGRMEAMERLVELQEQLGPINDALEELGIERIEYEPIDVSSADAGGAGAGGADPDASTVQNPAAQPIQTEAPEAAAAIENSNVEATNPNTGDPVTVDASTPEKQQAAMAAFGGIIPLETQEAEIQDSIQELFANVAPSDSTWLWTGAQEDFASGKNSDPVPPWCAAWVADMILRANPDFDFSAVESPSYGQTEKQAGEVNRVRAQHYQKIGEPVSKTGDQYDAQVGDVVIKKVGTQFHVGFFAGYDEDGNVLILGGNQADSLNVTPYPADQIVSVRRIDVAAIDKEDVEKISATMNSSGKVT